ncbi:TetR/AcrR family transcriptional regulator [Mycolicibacter sp. MYC123]|uniref:TetR/AcrR family transcriptional regulator n=1 Tax=[Mycobacterium] zoologicum TaxID=2872311 RepID=A0ABU5YJK6_9MYCO|nr:MULTISPECIES: TetR/AcrR family transcriptional regulator [unclassified Mycolicibacter]MEB3050036.1 TetR/AcrR family transcriptional regulator [Mycolicibacter sp. MYC123]MEB3062400.1 TetR/AcrR family transcriptional regulator [Mycolicibacter sp. MYC101]
MAESPRFQRLEPALRRESILAAATRLFSSLPYTQVSTAAIAGEAGVARGLVNHYFGTKRALYLEVVDGAATVPPTAVAALPAGDLDTRIESAVDWFLTSLSDAGGSWLTLSGSHNLSRDPELERILSAAEDTSVDRVIEAVGLKGDSDPEKLRALIRPYGQLARAAGREWLLKGTLTRPEAHRLLTETLSAIVRRVHPALSADGPGDRVPNRS